MRKLKGIESPMVRSRSVTLLMESIEWRIFSRSVVETMSTKSSWRWITLRIDLEGLWEGEVKKMRRP